MSESEKLKLIHAYLTKDNSSHDVSLFNEWLNTDPDNKVLYNQVAKIWQSASPPESIQFDYKKAYNNHLSKLTDPTPKLNVVKPSNNWFRIVSSLAAIFLLVIAAIFVFRSEGHQVIAKDFAQVHVLPDGSKAWLDKGATLAYEDFSNSQRNVTVSGIVFFEVSPNKKAPFTVFGDQFEVKVVGTKFLVNTISKMVAVKEGIVDVKDQKSINRITKDQKVVLNSDGDLVLSNALFDSSQLLWFNDDLIFKNAPFDRVVKDLSENFNINIKIPEKETWSACTFTSGSLKTSSLDQILEILKLTYDLEYSKQKDNSIKLTSVKCR